MNKQEEFEKNTIVTLHDLARFRQRLDEITDNVVGVEFALDNTDDNIEERIAAAGLCVLRIKQISQELSELIAEAIEG